MHFIILTPFYSHECYLSALILENPNLPGSISLPLEISLQNSKIERYTQLHFQPKITKTRQYYRLGVLEGLGDITPLNKAPKVDYWSMSSWQISLAKTKKLIAGKEYIERMRAIQNLDFEDEQKATEAAAKPQQAPTEAPSKKNEPDYNKFVF